MAEIEPTVRLTMPCPPPGWGHRLRGLPTALGLCCLLAARALWGAEGTVSKEQQLKAAFLYNFTKFIEWPPSRFADGNSPIVVGVLGRNSFSDELEKIVKDRTVNGRAITVRVVTEAAEVPAVHLLFIPAAEETRLPPAAWQQATVVGESEALAARGSTITFVQAGGKVRFEINIAAAERSGVKISAQLQKLATAVRREP